MYWLSHWLVMVANSNEIHIPAKMEMMAISWAMNPFFSPLMSAGMKHIKE